MKPSFHFLVLVIFCVSSLWAGDFEDGIAAYEKKNFSVALQKFRIAAAQGEAKAQHGLGMMYFSGSGVTQDYAEAVHFFKLAIAQDHPDAYMSLGWMYTDGIGVVRDYVKAYALFNIAAGQGNEHAIRLRESTAGKLSNLQIIQAQALANRCQAKQDKSCF